MFTTCRRDDCAYGIVHYDITLEAESWSRPGEYNQVAAAQRISAHTTPATTKATSTYGTTGVIAAECARQL